MTSLKHFISLQDFSADQINDLVKLSIEFKTERQKGEYRKPLKDKSIALIFEKPSTRTYVSFHVAIHECGGNPVTLGQTSLQGREALTDILQCLARYVHGIIIRTFDHDQLEELTGISPIPVINALTDLYHPCQSLADYMTMVEHYGSEKIHVSYLGDGFNVANSLLILCSKVGYDISIATPKGYEPDEKVIKTAQQNAKQSGSRINLLHSPVAAVQKADIIYTDTWTSMGLEHEQDKRIKHFQDYQVNRTLLSSAPDHVRVMHCLPAHRNLEITDHVIDGVQSIVFDQAENRLHAQKAVLSSMFSK